MSAGRYVRPQPLPDLDDRRHPRGLAWSVIVAALSLVVLARTPTLGADVLTLAGLVGFAGGGAWFAVLIDQRINS